MKKIVFIYFMHCAYMMAQEPLVDLASNAISKIHIVEYQKLQSSESKLGTSVSNFREKFEARTKYLLGGTIGHNLIKDKIKERIDAITSEINSIKLRNTELTPFFNSNQNKRAQQIELIEQQIDNIENNEFTQNNIINSIALQGDEINFYHDMIQSLAEIERHLDAINNELNQSELTRKLFLK